MERVKMNFAHFAQGNVVQWCGVKCAKFISTHTEHTKKSVLLQLYSDHVWVTTLHPPRNYTTQDFVQLFLDANAVETAKIFKNLRDNSTSHFNEHSCWMVIMFFLTNQSGTHWNLQGLKFIISLAQVYQLLQGLYSIQPSLPRKSLLLSSPMEMQQYQTLDYVCQSNGGVLKLNQSTLIMLKALFMAAALQT